MMGSAAFSTLCLNRNNETTGLRGKCPIGVHTGYGGTRSQKSDVAGDEVARKDYCAGGKLMETASSPMKLIVMFVSASAAWPFSS
jgi:hypothetical protein